MHKLSIVIPVFNEAEGITIFHETMLAPALKKIPNIDPSIIYVNDGSTDNSLEELGTIAIKNSNVQVLDLTKNFGKEIAVSAGIEHAVGDCVVIMDADGQHPPEIIKEFVNEWEGGGQVIVGVRRTNIDEGYIKKYGSKLFYQIFNTTSGSKLIPQSTDFRLIDACVRDEFMQFQERNRMTRGLIDWLGFEQKTVYFDAPARFSGEASYSTRKLISLALNTFLSLSIRPLLSLIALGVAITVGAILLGLFVFIEHIVLSDPLSWHVTGSAYLVIFVTFLVGLILMSQGIIAVYLSHVHAQVQGRPLYVVNKRSSIRQGVNHKK